MFMPEMAFDCWKEEGKNKRLPANIRKQKYKHKDMRWWPLTYTIKMYKVKYDVATVSVSFNLKDLDAIFSENKMHF